MNKYHLSEKELNDECIKFCSYLIDQKPGDYVLEKYRDAHRRGSIDQDYSRLEKFFLRAALINRFFTKLTDVYTRFFLQYAVFRKKLVLLFAILESCAPSCHYFDEVASASRIWNIILMLKQGFLFAFFFLLSLMIFMPLHIILKLFCKTADK